MTNDVNSTQESAPAQEQEEQQLKILLDYLFAHRMEFVQEFLKQQSLPYSYTKDVLRDKVSENVKLGILRIEQLITLLNRIEGWGDQHIYLYKAPRGLSQKWQEQKYVMGRLRDANCHHLFNNPIPLILPDSFELSAVEWSNTRVRFVWIERRTWEERVASEDEPPADKKNKFVEGQALIRDEIVWRPYRVRTARGLIAFDWDLISDEAMMLIQRLPNGISYLPIRDRFEQELQSLVDIQSFERVRVADVVRKLEESIEVRRTHMKLRSPNRSQIALTSPSESHDVYSDDPIVERARKAISSDATGMQGFLYWKPVPARLSREMYVRIYGDHDHDQRIGILAEHKEEDVVYVLSRIRNLCN